MNARPDDEFEGVFDDLTPQDFTPRATVTFPAESGDFNEFVAARIDATRLAYTRGKTLSHAVLSNGREIRQIAPVPNETMGDFLPRLTRHARDMSAHSFFFARIVDASIIVDGRGFGVLWIAHHIAEGEQELRSGLISINDGTLGDEDQVTFDESQLNGTTIGGAFTQVLRP